MQDKLPCSPLFMNFGSQLDLTRIDARQTTLLTTFYEFWFTKARLERSSLACACCWLVTAPSTTPSNP